MKKLVMVMCFALCASLAFAQTKSAKPHQWQGNDKTVIKKASVKDAETAKVGYSASIFGAKAAGDLVASWDFSSQNNGYTVGNITGGQITNESGSQESMVVHGQTNAHATWARFPDTNSSTIAQYANRSISNGGYPVICGVASWLFSYMDFPTVQNGYMAMSMCDQYSGWGGSGVVAPIDSYIKFDPISTTGHPSVKIEFYQQFRKFNYDRSYIDYSFDGTTWYQYEILAHTRNGGIYTSNQDIDGLQSILLPSACGNKANLHLRIRWASDQLSGGQTEDDGIYGYWWFLDDVNIFESDANSAKMVTDAYYAGYYYQIPQGLEVPITWFASVQNDGSFDQDNLLLGLNHFGASLSDPSQFASLSTGAVASGDTKDTMIDGAGIVRAWNQYNTLYLDLFGNGNAPSAYLPSTSAGDNYVAASYETTNITTRYGDTILYQVNALQESPDGVGQVAVWALDNGILTPYSYYTDGLNNDYLSEGLGDPDPSYTKEGYFALNRFITGNNIPNNWVIRGMQLVAATQYDASDASNTVVVMPGSHINTILYTDSAIGGGETGYLQGSDVITGAETYETKASDFNYYDANMERITRTSAGAQYKEYMLPGEYNVINIMFPEQPTLEANTAYRLGYQLVDGYFGVAGQTYRYVHHYDGDPDTTFYYVYYSADTMRDGTPNNLRKYGRYFNTDPYNQIIYDPDQGWTRGTSNRAPMIRMLVGPRAAYPTFNANIQCVGYDGLNLSTLEGTGAFSRADESYVCGQTVQMTSGSSNSGIIAEAESGYIVYSISANGAVVYTTGSTTYDENVITHGTSSGIDYVIFDMSNYALDVDVVVTFAEEGTDATLHTITVSSDNETMGTAIGGGEFDEGASTTITAIPNNGYIFSYWEKDGAAFDGNDANPLTITVEDDAEYVAYFEEGTLPEYTITVNVEDPSMGSAIGGGTYAEGSIVTITAIPNPGYVFQQWSDGNTQQARNIVVNGNATYTASFVSDGSVVNYHLEVVSANPTMGTTTGTGDYAAGTSVQIKATPNSGYRFVRWNDNNTQAQRTVVVNGNVTYTAYFEQGGAQGINDVASNVSMSLYPNPANNNVKLDITGVNGNVNCTILDMSGRVVYSQSINAEEATTINVSNFAKGAYFVRITNHEFTKVEKLVVR